MTLSTEARQVLHHAATGLSNAAIADRLGIPIATVRQHMTDALRALGGSSRLDAIMKAARQHLIDLPR
jgi:DNA-binding NarL/FixJ family response regulator